MKKVHFMCVPNEHIVGSTISQIHPLQSICLDFVAEHVCHYRLSQLTELPHSVLTLLVKYLSTHGLLLLDGVFNSKGISTDDEWQKRVQRQCPYRFQRPISLFYDDFRGRRDRRRARNVFMERHFRNIIEQMGTDASYQGIALHARPFMINPSTRNRCSLPTVLRRMFDSLSDFAITVEILTVNASSISQVSLLLDTQLTDILQTVARRLDFHFLTRASFDQCLRLAQVLISHGSVTEVSLFQSHLPSLDIYELYKVFSSRRLQCIGGLPDRTLTDTENSSVSSTSGSLDEVPKDVDSRSLGSIDGVPEEELDDDLFDFALMPPGYSVEVERLHMANVNVGIEALSMVNCTFGGIEFDEILGISLRVWNALKKLAIVGTTTDTSKYEKPLCDAVRKGWLTHLVLDNCGFSVNFVSLLLSAILSRAGPPLEQLTLLLPDYFPVLIGDDLLSELGKRRLHGAVRLDLSHNQFQITDDGGDDLEFVAMWIRNDAALKHLILKQFDAPLLMHGILDSIRANGHLESLDLQGVPIIERSHQDSLIAILQSTSTLKKLNVKECSLPSDFVVRVEFINAVTQHPSLVNLNVAANRLEECACSLLTAIYLAKSSGNGARFQKLNISFNRISSKSLLAVASELAKVGTGRHAAVMTLDISGNVFGDRRQEIVQQFEISVSKVVGLTIDFASEHLSQM